MTGGKPTPARLPAEIIDALLAGKITRGEALGEIESMPAEDLGYATLDHDRARRCGFPEAIYAPGKRPGQAVEIFARLAARNPNVLCTRASEEVCEALTAANPEAEADPQGSGLVWLWRDREPRGVGPVLVLSAGTADQNVAFEAWQSALVMGNEARLVSDVGVAGLHRLLRHREVIDAARVIIAVAGMDAALPSVVAGLVDRPVIAVPTSAGYGAGAGGFAALLAALSSCAAGVTTVNIDNGFGAAAAATLINRP